MTERNFERLKINEWYVMRCGAIIQIVAENKEIPGQFGGNNGGAWNEFGIDLYNNAGRWDLIMHIHPPFEVIPKKHWWEFWK